MSQLSEPSEPGRNNLRRALRTLPAHEPDPATWARLEAQLAADAALTQVLPTLPTHEPDDTLWATIAAQLDTTAVPAAVPVPAAVVRLLWPTRVRRRVLALAASLLLLVGIGWWQLHSTTSPPAVATDTLTFSEEASMPLPSPLAADPLEAQAFAFAEAHCSSQPQVCQSGEFRTLRTQLQELESQEAQLRQATRRFGSSPELRREQARLVSLKAAFTRQLVQLFIS